MIIRFYIFFILFLPLTVLANGYPVDEFESGVQIGEAVKSDNISIEKEVLIFDLTSLPSTHFATIKANYSLAVDSSKKSVKIVFVAHQLIENKIKVTLDNEPISFTTTHLDTLPSFLKLPVVSPTFLERDTTSYSMLLDSTGYILFELSDLTNGNHELVVEYQIKPAILHKDFGSLTRIWQISYALAPAGYWKSFSDLEVQVQLPKKWEAVCNLNLSEDDYLLVGNFDELPAENVLISARMNGISTYNKVDRFRIPLYIFAGLLFLFLLCKFVQKQYNKPRYGLKLGLFILFTSLILPLVWYHIELNVIPITNHFLNGEVNQNLLDSNGYGLIMYAIFFAPVILICSILSQVIIAAFFYIRLKKKASN